MTNKDIQKSAELLSSFPLEKVEKLMWLSAGLYGLLRDVSTKEDYDMIKDIMHKADRISSHSFARGLWWYSLIHYMQFNINQIALEMKMDYITVWKAVKRFEKLLKTDQYTKERWLVIKEHIQYDKEWLLQD